MKKYVNKILFFIVCYAVAITAVCIFVKAYENKVETQSKGYTVSITKLNKPFEYNDTNLDTLVLDIEASVSNNSNNINKNLTEQTLNKAKENGEVINISYNDAWELDNSTDEKINVSKISYIYDNQNNYYFTLIYDETSKCYTYLSDISFVKNYTDVFDIT